MGDTFNVGPISGSSFAFGSKSRNYGAVVNGDRDPEGLHAEIADLEKALAALPASQEVEEARIRAQQLDDSVADEAPPAVIEHSWKKLQLATAALAVGANIAQIASFVQPFLS